MTGASVTESGELVTIADDVDLEVTHKDGTKETVKVRQIPVYPTSQQLHATMGHYGPHHRGGLIGSSISGLGRFHSGGSIGGGSVRGAGVTVLNFTDLKALVRELGSRDGQKIIVDTVRGNRIDLGM
jgi:hypothetical protein